MCFPKQRFCFFVKKANTDRRIEMNRNHIWLLYCFLNILANTLNVHFGSIRIKMLSLDRI